MKLTSYSRALMVAAVTFAGAAGASAATLVSYEFNDDSVAPTELNASVGASSFAAVGTTGSGEFYTRASFDPSNPPAYQASGWSTDATFDPDITTFFEFTVTPTEDVVFTGFTFLMSKNANGANNYTAAYSLDGFASDVTIVDSGTVGPQNSGTPTTFNPAGGAMTLTTDQVVTFRIYGYGGAGTGNFRVDNVTVTTVPEPASVSLLLGGGMLLLLRRKRQA